MSQLKKQPDFFFERKLWRKGFKVVVGVDEVGRGCFAGPVVAAAAAFAPNFQFSISNFQKEGIIVDDCKKMTPRQREKAEPWIKENALAWGIGETPTVTINRLGMAKATKKAFRKAIVDCNRRLLTTAYRLQKENKKTVVGRRLAVDFLLIDAFFIPYIPGLPTRRKKDKKGRFRKNPKGKQLAIIDGDQKSISIAAASIIAKVHRDKFMTSLSKQSKYKKYGWERNKGYGTKEHQEAILKYGITKYHRKQFVKNFI